MSLLQRQLDRFFDEDGPLAQKLHPYAKRPAQIEMAEAIAEAVSQEKGRLVVEAGTGTGKSLAYLAVALLSDQKVVISTATKTLQDQLFKKDLPLALDVVEKLGGQKKRVLMMKGRGNYLCLHKAETFSPTGQLFNRRDNLVVDRLRDFIRETETGDRAEISELPDDSALWHEISAKADTCLGQECPLYNECFVTQMRRQAQSADVIVVNHSLLCADRSLRIKTAIEADHDLGVKDQAFAQIIPDADLWVIDEAHALIDVATRHFGVTLSALQVKMLARDLVGAVALVRSIDQATFKTSTETLATSFGQLIELLAKSAEQMPQQSVLQQVSRPDISEEFDRTIECLRAIEVALTTGASGEATEKAVLNALSRRVSKAAVELQFMLSESSADAGYITFIERDNRGPVLSAAPVDAAQVLARTLWSSPATIVLTSATLAVNGKMDSFLRQSGFVMQSDQEVANLILPAPFDFENQSALYVPEKIATPLEANFQKQLEDEIQFLLSMSKGGAFLLFTSHRVLNATYQSLKGELEARGLVVLKQGDAPKLELLSDFIAADETWGAVLFATHSFWEGVDVRGKALRLVVIDRLPFKSPEDPILKARTERLENEGLSPFALLSLPEAALTLKQGVGRLLRTHQDAGVVAILDSRIYQKNYGRVLLNTLPPMTRLRTKEELQKFWDQNVLCHFC